MNPQLSKSEFMMFLKHPALLWLKKHDKKKIPPPDANLQAIFDEGNIFESYANKMFPNSVDLGFTSYQEYLDLPHQTTKALKTGAEVITQGRFEAKNLTCIVDVLKRVEGDTYDLYEIKSSTSAKTEHEIDLSFQTIVLEEYGLKIRKVYVIHANNEYVRKGDIDIKEITKTVDVTEVVRERIPSTKLNIEKAMKVIDMKNIPDISPSRVRMGAMYDWMEIYKNLKIVDPYSIYNICRPSAPLFKSLEDAGIELLKDIPEDFELNEKQLAQVQAVKSGKRHIDQEKVDEFIGSLTYPIYFFDYETFSGVIPKFDGLKPYQQVPFQYSLHILDKPKGELTHKEYLHTEKSNSVEPLILQMKKDFGDTGSILVWYEQFEKSRNKEMAEMHPEHADFLLGLNERIVDLMMPFSDGTVVDKQFMGSSSIKKVLPVIIPELSYESLYIREGAGAQRTWVETILEDKNDKEKDKIIEALLEYCKLDTFAMVEIFRFLNGERVSDTLFE